MSDQPELPPRQGQPPTGFTAAPVPGGSADADQVLDDPRQASNGRPPDDVPRHGPGGGAQPALPRTGDDTVDAAIEDLVDVTSLPLEHQVDRYVGAHRKLQDRLADLDG